MSLLIKADDRRILLWIPLRYDQLWYDYDEKLSKCSICFNHYLVFRKDYFQSHFFVLIVIMRVYSLTFSKYGSSWCCFSDHLERIKMMSCNWAHLATAAGRHYMRDSILSYSRICCEFFCAYGVSNSKRNLFGTRMVKFNLRSAAGVVAFASKVDVRRK